MIYLVLYVLMTILFIMGVVFSISDMRRLTASMNGKFAQNVKPEALQEEDKHAC